MSAFFVKGYLNLLLLMVLLLYWLNGFFIFLHAEYKYCAKLLIVNLSQSCVINPLFLLDFVTLNGLILMAIRLKVWLFICFS